MCGADDSLNIHVAVSVAISKIFFPTNSVSVHSQLLVRKYSIFRSEMFTV